MKKVLVIAPYSYLPFYSGGQKFIAQFLEYLGRAVDLSVVSVADNDSSLAKSYQIIPLLKKSFSRYFDRSLVSKISELVKKEGFDTVIWEHPYYSWLAQRIRNRTGVKMIIHTHNIEYQRFRSTHRWWWPILKMYERRCFRKADKIFFITPEDRDFAVNNWGIDPSKCIDLPYGIGIKEYPGDRDVAHAQIAVRHGIGPDEKILLFSGALSYPPNLDALRVILNKITPRLIAEGNFRYKILVCGKGWPEEFKVEDYKDKNIIYAGFVRDIDMYCKAASILLNPVQSGGGIKTKMVEGIAYGATVVSSRTGAAGMDPALCGDKLVIVDDNDWNGFVNAIVRQKDTDSPTPAAFYKRFYWGNIINTISELGF